MKLNPDRDRLELFCHKHRQWLVAHEPTELDYGAVPEVLDAVNRLRKLRRRHGDLVILNLYSHIHEFLTADWRGFGWHSELSRRWETRQQLGVSTVPTELFIRSRTDRWSMLPEAVAIIAVLASHYWSEVAVPKRDLSHIRFYMHLGDALGLRTLIAVRDVQEAIHLFRPLPEWIIDEARDGGPPQILDGAALHRPPEITANSPTDDKTQHRKPLHPWVLTTNY